MHDNKKKNYQKLVSRMLSKGAKQAITERNANDYDYINNA